MSRANTTTVTRMVYENLGITDGTYGNYKTNQRYPKSYILDAIAGADIMVMKTLLKSKQFHFTHDFFSTLAIPSAVPVALPPNIELLTVSFNNGPYTERGVEIPWEMYEMFTEPLEETSLFEFEGDSTKNYGGYFSIKDHYLHTIPFSNPGYIIVGQPIQFVRTVVAGPPQEIYLTANDHGLSDDDLVVLESTVTLPAGLYPETVYYVVDSDQNTFKLALSQGGTPVSITSNGTGNHYVNVVTSQNVGSCKYIALPQPSSIMTAEGNLTLVSPQSFEQAIAFLASATLLMKRSDQPEQASFYLQQYQIMMGLYMTPSTNQSRTIDQ